MTKNGERSSKRQMPYDTSKDARDLPAAIGRGTSLSGSARLTTEIEGDSSPGRLAGSIVAGALGNHVLERIAMRLPEENLVVEMAARRMSRVAHESDDLPAFHLLPAGHEDLREMGVPGRESVLVAHLDHEAESAVSPRHAHDAVGGAHDGAPHPRAIVEPRVMDDLAEKRIHSPPETAREESPLERDGSTACCSRIFCSFSRTEMTSE